ncbi:hypothetical protein KBB74_02935 [Candidatus Parcubacteria bacterium]|nr:hypothetical protein [Candidatus Parcubacteria bacterium]
MNEKGRVIKNNLAQKKWLQKRKQQKRKLQRNQQRRKLLKRRKNSSLKQPFPKGCFYDNI